MFSKPPISRLFVVKFLGLFGGYSTPQDENKEVHKDIASPGEVSLNAAVLQRKRSHQSDYKDAIEQSSKKLVACMLEKGIPGLTICVSMRGKIVWHSAFGFCDVENQVECSPEARMRIASISKALFAATVVAPMVEKGNLDIKSSIYNYLKPEEFPRKTFEGKEVDITIEQLLSHTGGIISYDSERERREKPIGSPGSLRVYQCDDQFNRLGFYQRETYRNVIDALEPFRDKPLEREPGNYGYTTYGYTLLSAVVEKAHQQSGGQDERTKKEQIEDFWARILRQDWKMTETSLDQDEVIIPNRARYYLRSARNGALINAPYADNSVKWAGGGIISSARDLVKFGNALVDSYKCQNNPKLKRETVELLWKEIKSSYGLGFQVAKLDSDESGGERVAVYHLGNAVGAASALIIYPESEIVVAILTNMGELGLFQVGRQVANQFVKVQAIK